MKAPGDVAAPPATLTAETLRSLEEDHGDAFYLLDVERFEDNYRRFLSAFRTHYARARIAYSYKTNYAPRLCRAVDALGGYAEVVSGMEYDLALRVGVAPSRIVFNGPGKPADVLERALVAGAVVNLDSLDEVRVVEAIARRRPATPLAVGLRCTFDIGTDEISRFGFDVEGGELVAALARLRRVPTCRIAGLHSHFSARDRSAASFARRTHRMLALAAKHFPGAPPPALDVGGGFFSEMGPELRRQFGIPVPTFADYAEAVAAPVARAYPGASGPELILEPGTALVADVLQFVARIVAVKRVRGRAIAVTSGSVYNVKPTLHARNLPLRLVRADGAGDGAREPVDIVGYTCMEHDCLYRAYPGPVAAGDYVVVDNVGAYTIVLKPPFIRPAPPVLARDAATGRIELVRRREEPSDVFSTYVF